jgi:hypothetical protein
VQRNDIELACRDYYEYLQRFFSKKAGEKSLFASVQNLTHFSGIRDVVKSHMSPSDEYEKRKKAAFDAVASFESYTNALFMKNQMELHGKIDMLSEMISRLETSKHEGNTGNEEAEF